MLLKGVPGRLESLENCDREIVLERQVWVI
jgi:hypothetical protein